ncbi:hypothetical protein SKAU_G00228770 [Synaphobranchus kaupii]|uniref:Uncharacterized protein n=1 Tax=Synaphobranchus kaupii TaxID=118154 RepID=A0A9Q1IT47_SYNKA|nr:hypothetical protein SKAU_G00228770 [Synaphobranchus kaupii]
MPKAMVYYSEDWHRDVRAAKCARVRGESRTGRAAPFQRRGGRRISERGRRVEQRTLRRTSGTVRAQEPDRS